MLNQFRHHVGNLRNRREQELEHDLPEAARTGDLKKLNKLLKRKHVLDNVTNYQNEALRLANENNHPEIFARLLEIPAVSRFEMFGNGTLLREVIAFERKGCHIKNARKQ